MEVPAKDAQMSRWCVEVSKETGQTWKYLKVMQPVFERGGFATFTNLVSKVLAESN